MLHNNQIQPQIQMSNTKKSKSTRKKSKSTPKKSKPTKQQRRQSKLLNLIKAEHKSNPSSKIYLLHKSNGFESIPPLIQSQSFGTASTIDDHMNTSMIQSNNNTTTPQLQMYNSHKDRLEILSFIFSNESEEEEFKMAKSLVFFKSSFPN